MKTVLKLGEAVVQSNSPAEPVNTDVSNDKLPDEGEPNQTEVAESLNQETHEVGTLTLGVIEEIIKSVYEARYSPPNVSLALVLHMERRLFFFLPA